MNHTIDNCIDKIKNKLPKYMLPVIFDFAASFLLIDCIVSGIALNCFYSRLVYKYDLNIPNADIYEKSYEIRMKNEGWFSFTEKFFSNEKMVKTYPNLKLKDADGNIVFIKNILSDIKPYYFKFFTPKDSNLKLTNVESVNYVE